MKPFRYVVWAALLGGPLAAWALPAISFRVVPSDFPSTDAVVAGFTDQDLALDRSGKADCSAAMQEGLDALGKAGGGTLFLASGTYRIEQPLSIPPAVTLRGEIRPTSDPYRYEGTCLAAYAGKGDFAAKPLVTLQGSSGIRDSIVWYPEQQGEKVIPFPPTIQHFGPTTTTENMVFINSYQIYRSGYNMSGRAYLRKIRGTGLYLGLEIDGLADTGRVEDVKLSPEYWAHSGLPGAESEAYRDFMFEHGTGVMLRRTDWTYTCGVEIEGCARGLYLTYSLAKENLQRKQYKGSPNGSNFGYTIRHCQYGVAIDNTANSGNLLINFDVQATKSALWIGKEFNSIATLLSATLRAPGYALESHGAGRLLLRDVKFQNGATLLEGGVLACAGGDFAAPACRIEAGAGLENATFAGTHFAHPPELPKDAPVHFSQIGLSPPPIKFAGTTPNFDLPHHPARLELFDVTAFGARGDGVTDGTKAFQEALAKAGEAGGGIVFVPGGSFLLTAPLNVPAGVELRGVCDSAHDGIVPGSCLFVATGKGQAAGAPFLVLQAGSGLRGLGFHYPEQVFEAPMDFPFLLEGHGADIHLVDLAMSNASRIADFSKARCDRLFIDHIDAQPLHVGIKVGGGSQDVVVADCQFNPVGWTRASYANAPAAIFGKDSAKKNAAAGQFSQWLKEHGDDYVLGDCAVNFFQNFAFDSQNGLHCIPENGRGPSGVAMNFGVDTSTVSVRIDALGERGLPFIGSQLVSSGSAGTDGRRSHIVLGLQFTGTAEFYGLDAWGPHTNRSFDVQGGTLRVDGAHLRDSGSPVCQLKNGSFVMTASCVRRETPVFTMPPEKGVTCIADIFPKSAMEYAILQNGINIFHDDADRKSHPPTVP